MNDDELRSRLNAIDPAAHAVTDPADSPSARTLLENVMAHDDIDMNTATSADAPATVTDIATKRRWPVAILGAAAVAVLAVGGAAIGGVFDGDDAPDEIATPTTAVTEPDDLPTDSIDEATDPSDESIDGASGDASVLALSAGTSDPAMMSCIRPDASVVAQSPTAFRGVVESVGGDDQTAQVVLAVDRWYVGGDADVVTIAAPLGLEALIGSIDFVVGEPYLISAFEGTVSYCGLSGAATPELQAMYDEAFPG